jgi:hypothetical protein
MPDEQLSEEQKKERGAKLIPKVEAIPIEDHPESSTPADHLFKDGQFKKSTGQDKGELFALCIHDADAYGFTHSLKNTVHFWQGTEKQFRENFEKI